MLTSILMTQQLRLLIAQSRHKKVFLGQTPRRVRRPMVPNRLIALIQVNKPVFLATTDGKRRKFASHSEAQHGDSAPYFPPP